MVAEILGIITDLVINFHRSRLADAAWQIAAGALHLSPLKDTEGG
jgi:hypothetical protein